MGEMVDTKPKAKAKKKGPISRSVSLDTGVFLLKMFIPMSSFGLKKHKQTSRSMSTDGSRKYPVDVKQYWKTWLFVENNNTVSSRLSDNNKDRSTTVKIRYGRYWFTSKSTNQKGCIFF
ncbi:uncharacterized protein LOC112508532 [Cynara cardunculus var. scolymus]|nr:uncharacterized protein LOC112508532 [Cynara cardunculus var. scolymus]